MLRPLTSGARASGAWTALSIVAVAAALRFYALPGRGLIFWDEGKFTLEGVRMLSILQSFPLFDPVRVAGKAVGTAKPTHALLIGISYLLFGVHDYAPLYLDAASSLAQIGVLFLVVHRLFDYRTAVVAAALLAVSGYDVVYARSALSESDADLCFAAGVLLWAHAWNWDRNEPANRPVRMRVVSGVVLGLAFTVNYRLIIYIAALLLVDGLAMWKQRSLRFSLQQGIPWVVGLAVVPCLWQLAGWFAGTHGIVLFRGEITYRRTTYWAETMYQLHGGKQAVTRFDPTAYIAWFLDRQGWPVTLLFALGLIAAMVKRSLAAIAMAALVVVPYVIYTFAPFIVPRNMDAALPWAAAVAAVGLVSLLEHLRLDTVHPFLLAAATCIVMVTGILQAAPLAAVRSGYARAALYIEEHGDGAAFVVNQVMMFYLREPGLTCRSPKLPYTLSDFRASTGRSVPYAVLDQYGSPAERYLRRHARRLATFQAAGSSNLDQRLIDAENVRVSHPSVIRAVTVYDLRGLRGASRPRPAPACTQDRIA